MNKRINFNNLSTNNNTLIVQLIGVSNAIRKYAIDMVAKQEINTKTKPPVIPVDGKSFS